ncbi:MAG: tetratricopeptide repeat protein [Steroidobacteraceae bacterium]
MPAALPLPSELAHSNPSIKTRVRGNQWALKWLGLELTRSRIEDTLQSIDADYGPRSVEGAQALTETMLMIIDVDQDYVHAKPYAIRSLQRHRLVYGEWHRETAYALQDLASLDRMSQSTGFSPDAIPLMREAIEVRRRVLGPDHLEVAGGERELSAQLYEQWRHDAKRQPQDPRLAEATGAAAHAYLIFRAAKGAGDGETNFVLETLQKLGRARSNAFPFTLADLKNEYSTDAPFEFRLLNPQSRAMNVLVSLESLEQN